MTRLGRQALPDSSTRAARGRLSHAFVRGIAFATRLFSQRAAHPRDAVGPGNSTHGSLAGVLKLILGAEKGQALVEEVLILALIAVVGVGALVALGGQVGDTIGSVASSFGVLESSANRGGK